MKKIVNIIKAAAVLLPACFALSACSYDAAIAGGTYGQGVLFTPAPAEEQQPEQQEYYSFGPFPGGEEDSLAMDEEEFSSLKTELCAWLKVRIFENGFDKLEAYREETPGELTGQEGWENIDQGSLMAQLSESVSMTDEYTDLIAANADKDPELYELWLDIKDEVNSLYEQAVGIPEGAELDLTALRELSERFYTQAENGGNSGDPMGVSTEEPEEPGEPEEPDEPSEPDEPEEPEIELYQEARAVYAAKGAKICAQPDEDTQGSALPTGTKLTIVGEFGDWYVISRQEGEYSYIKIAAVSDTPPETATTTTKKKTTTTTTTTTSQRTTTTTTTTTTKRTTTTTTTRRTTTTTTTRRTTTTTTTTKKKPATSKTTSAGGTNANDPVNEVLRLVNEERAKVGAAPLKLNSKLCQAADTRAKEQAVKFGHERPDGTMFSSLLDNLGFVWGGNYFARAENVAKGQKTAAQVVNDWMNSKEGHRENILNTRYSEIGIGYDKASNSWAQIFIGR